MSRRTTSSPPSRCAPWLVGPVTLLVVTALALAGCSAAGSDGTAGSSATSRTDGDTLPPASAEGQGETPGPTISTTTATTLAPSTIAPTSTTTAPTTTVPPTTVPPTTTTEPWVTAGATVIVANASGVPGAATAITTELRKWGFALTDPVNATAWDERLDVSKVYSVQDSASLAIARSVVTALHSVRPDLALDVLPMPTPAPIDGATAGLGGATVLVMTGRDLTP